MTKRSPKSCCASSSRNFILDVPQFGVDRFKFFGEKLHVGLIQASSRLDLFLKR